MMQLSVIIPTYFRVKALGRLLGSLAEQRLPKESWEVLVVSNLQDPGTEALVQRMKEHLPVRCLTAGQKGANIARNLGIREASGELLLLLDDDCRLQNPNYLQEVLELHAAHPNALAIGGRYSLAMGASAEDTAYNLIAREWQWRSNEEVHASLRLIGGNVSYKREKLLAINELFSEKIQYGGAELEFHHRLAAKGAELLLAPQLTVEHLPEIEKHELVYKAYKQAVTQVKFSIPDRNAPAAHRVFQEQRRIHALRSPHADRVCALMREYDRAYNLVSEEKILSFPKLRRRLWAERWLPWRKQKEAR